MKKTLFYILSLGLLFSSCRTIVDWDLPNADPALIVEASISNDTVAWTVFLNRTRDYFDNSKSEEVANAVVTISDDMGNTDTLHYWADGLYLTSEIKSCIPGHYYTLNIDEGGKTYTSTELCRPQLQFDTVFYFFQEAANIFIEEGYYIFEIAKEIEGKGDYYEWTITKNDTLQDDFGYILDSDEFADFSYFNQNIDFDNITPDFRPRPFPFKFDKGDRVVIEQRCVSKNYYDFLIEFQTQHSRAGSPFDAPSANPIGNVEGAFGYFAVMNSQKAVVHIED